MNIGDEHQYCTFYVAGHYFGLEVLKVQEIIRYQQITRVPLAPAVVSGLINLRGQIVTALDMRRRLDLPDREPGEEPINVVVQTDDGAVSLLVDEIGDVRGIRDQTLEAPPETLQGSARELIRGAYKMPDQLLLILNTERVVEVVSDDSL